MTDRPCYCYPCHTAYGSRGIASHRAAHMRAGEEATIRIPSYGTHRYVPDPDSPGRWRAVIPVVGAELDALDEERSARERRRHP